MPQSGYLRPCRKGLGPYRRRRSDTWTVPSAFSILMRRHSRLGLRSARTVLLGEPRPDGACTQVARARRSCRPLTEQQAAFMARSYRRRMTATPQLLTKRSCVAGRGAGAAAARNRAADSPYISCQVKATAPELSVSAGTRGQVSIDTKTQSIFCCQHIWI